MVDVVTAALARSCTHPSKRSLHAFANASGSVVPPTVVGGKKAAEEPLSRRFAPVLLLLLLLLLLMLALPFHQYASVYACRSTPHSLP